MGLEGKLIAILKDAQAQGQKRQFRTVSNSGAHISMDGRKIINFSSNDYLGLSREENIIEAAQESLARFGSAASSARLVSGTFAPYLELESRLAEFKQTEAALIFGAGYLANIGVISALAGRSDLVISDKLCHASLLDGIALSRAKHLRFRHNDLVHLEDLLISAAKLRTGSQQIFIVVESVYSMDGDLAPISRLFELAKAYQAVMIVDEAHAIGVFNGGRGVISPPPSDVELIQTATLSKSFAAYGGVCFASSAVKEFLINKSRSFIFNTAVPPSCIASATAALDLILANSPLGEELLSKAAIFSGQLIEAGFAVGESASQIIPIHIGDNDKAVKITEQLLEKGVLAVAIRPPTVPQGTARLRLSLSVEHTKEDLDFALGCLQEVFKEEGIL